MSGGTAQTHYYVSGLVKNDEGIAINTGYEKQAVRANLDQDLADWIQLSVNTQRDPQPLRPRALQQRQLGHQPIPGVPVHPELHRSPAAGPEITDFPLNPFERSNPIQTFSFLKNNEDTWRALGTVTARMT